MYFQKDYILRLIESMGEFFLKIKDMITDSARLHEVDRIIREMCGMSLDAAMNTDIHVLCELLVPKARLLLSEALYIRAATVREGEPPYDRVLQLLLSLNQDGSVCECRQERMLELLERCQEQLTADDCLKAAVFFLTCEKLELMENMLFQAAEIAEKRDKCVAEALVILQDADKLSDEALTLGGLPRNELMMAKEDLERMI